MIEKWNTIDEWKTPTSNSRNDLYRHIVNYHKERGKNFYIFSSLLLSDETVSFLQKCAPEIIGKAHITIVNVVETCPIGLNKKECEQYWKFNSGLIWFAYKDCIIENIPVRIHLNRQFRCVGIEITESIKEKYKYKKDGISINYITLIDWLKQEEVWDIIIDTKTTLPSDHPYMISKIIRGKIILNHLFNYTPIEKEHKKSPKQKTHIKKPRSSSENKEQEILNQPKLAISDPRIWSV